MIHSILSSISEYLSIASLLDIAAVWFMLGTTTQVTYIGRYLFTDLHIKLPLLNIRNYSTWRPYFKKDGYYGLFVDQIIWK